MGRRACSPLQTWGRRPSLLLTRLSTSSTQASSYDLSELKTLDKPLRPIFVSPASELVSSTAANNASYYAVVCASASKLASEEDGMERARGFTYVQGSGDE